MRAEVDQRRERRAVGALGEQHVQLGVERIAGEDASQEMGRRGIDLAGVQRRRPLVVNGGLDCSDGLIGDEFQVFRRYAAPYPDVVGSGMIVRAGDDYGAFGDAGVSRYAPANVRRAIRRVDPLVGEEMPLRVDRAEDHGPFTARDRDCTRVDGAAYPGRSPDGTEAVTSEIDRRGRRDFAPGCAHAIFAARFGGGTGGRDRRPRNRLRCAEQKRICSGGENRSMNLSRCAHHLGGTIPAGSQSGVRRRDTPCTRRGRDRPAPRRRRCSG